MKQSGPLKRYSARLTVAQAAKGIQVALANAKAILADAELLFNEERWPRASSLAVLAIEEAGKPMLLRSLLLARDDNELREEWRNYRNHTQKNLMSIFPQLVGEGVKQLEGFRAIFAESGEHGQLLEAVKQLGFYSDVYGNCHWSTPDTVITQDMAHGILNVAQILVGQGEGAMISEAELSLWVKHMKPVWKSDMADMKQALLACYAEAEQLGVLTGANTASDMAKFIL